MTIEVASIFRPSKLYRKLPSKWRWLFVHKNYIKKARWHDVETRRYWCINVILTLIQRVESVGIT